MGNLPSEGRHGLVNEGGEGEKRALPTRRFNPLEILSSNPVVSACRHSKEHPRPTIRVRVMPPLGTLNLRCTSQLH